MVTVAPTESTEQPVHLSVPDQDGRRELCLFRGRRLHRESLRVHVAPVHVLQVRRAVQKERGEVRLQCAIDGVEQIELQLIQYEGASPPVSSATFRHELPDDGARRRI